MWFLIVTKQHMSQAQEGVAKQESLYVEVVYSRERYLLVSQMARDNSMHHRCSALCNLARNVT